MRARATPMAVMVMAMMMRRSRKNARARPLGFVCASIAGREREEEEEEASASASALSATEAGRRTAREKRALALSRSLSHTQAPAARPALLRPLNNTHSQRSEETRPHAPSAPLRSNPSLSLSLSAPNPKQQQPWRRRPPAASGSGSTTTAPCTRPSSSRGECRTRNTSSGAFWGRRGGEGKTARPERRASTGCLTNSRPRQARPGPARRAWGG